MLKWLWLSVIVVVLDQATKWLANTRLDYGEPVAVMPLFNLTLLYNQGAAFSFLSDAGGWQRWFFASVAIGISVWLVLWIRRLQSDQRVLAIALSLVIGGALGNLWDRLYYGYVVDFLDFYYQSYHWPAFNIADSAISVGAVLLVYDALFVTETSRDNEQQS